MQTETRETMGEAALFAVAPMMDWTDRHDRWFLRRISKHARLYTEMVTAAAIVHGDRERLLGFDASEHPVALQLGGSEPELLAEAARIGADYGYNEINLNCGCPSDRVQRGAFGACLMLEPDGVARSIEALRAAVDLPVTVKCRIGVDDADRYEDLRRFVDIVASAGCEVFIVHARKAWLQGLSPKQNREIPPLRYDDVYRLKAERPDLTVAINGGLTDLDMAAAQLDHVDGVMLGRAAYQDPWILADVDRRFFGDATPTPTREQVALDLADYIDRWVAAGGRAGSVLRHCVGLYRGQRGGRAFRRHLAEHGFAPEADGAVIRAALARVDEAGERKEAA